MDQKYTGPTITIPHEQYKAMQEVNKELLEACELIVLFCERDGKPVDGFRFREGVALARKAIAKAEGKP